MKKYIIYAVFILLIISITAVGNTYNIELDNNDNVIIVCNYQDGNRTYNVTNVDGVLQVVEIPDDTPTGNWSDWSPWWVMYNAPPGNETPVICYISKDFGGSVTITVEDNTSVPVYIVKIFGGFVIVNQSSNGTEDWIQLDKGWNNVVSTKDMSIYNIIVKYNGKTMSWLEAYQNRIVYKYWFTLQYKKVDYIYENIEYRVYAYKECDIKL